MIMYRFFSRKNIIALLFVNFLCVQFFCCLAQMDGEVCDLLNKGRVNTKNNGSQKYNRGDADKTKKKAHINYRPVCVIGAMALLTGAALIKFRPEIEAFIYSLPIAGDGPGEFISESSSYITTLDKYYTFKDGRRKYHNRNIECIINESVEASKGYTISTGPGDDKGKVYSIAISHFYTYNTEEEAKQGTNKIRSGVCVFCYRNENGSNNCVMSFRVIDDTVKRHGCWVNYNFEGQKIEQFDKIKCEFTRTGVQQRWNYFINSLLDQKMPGCDVTSIMDKIRNKLSALKDKTGTENKFAWTNQARLFLDMCKSSASISSGQAYDRDRMHAIDSPGVEYELFSYPDICPFLWAILLRISEIC